MERLGRAGYADVQITPAAIALRAVPWYVTQAAVHDYVFGSHTAHRWYLLHYISLV